jgi:hypothetical protein
MFLMCVGAARFWFDATGGIRRFWDKLAAVEGALLDQGVGVWVG